MHRKPFRPLLIQELKLWLPGIRFRLLQLNRHLSAKEEIKSHEHPFTQCLLYLAGNGEQSIGRGRFPALAGSLFLLPPRIPHAFHCLGLRSPLCLVLDFDELPKTRKHPVATRLNQSEMRQVQHALSSLARIHSGDHASRQIQVGAVVLTLFDVLLKAAKKPSQGSRPFFHPAVRRMEKLLTHPETSHLPIRDLARQMGYQVDYLNRVVKQATGLSLGQFKAQKTLEKAGQLLGTSLKIQDVAERAGFSDQNYFARWFRRQTGQTPSQWQRNH